MDIKKQIGTVLQVFILINLSKFKYKINESNHFIQHRPDHGQG